MKVLSKKQIFSQYKTHELEDGLTIGEILNELDFPDEVKCYVDVRINGYKIYPKTWDRCRPNPESITTVAIVPAGGDSNGLATLATIGLVFAAGPAAGALGATGLAKSVLAAGITLAGSQLINSMFPPSIPDLNSESRSSSPVITSQSNRVDLYGPVIRNYGRNRVFPRVVAEPFIYYIGNDQYFKAIYDFGIGEQYIQDATIKIGDTSANQYAGFDKNVANTPDQLRIYTNTVATEAFNVPFNEVNDSAIRTSPELTESIELNIRFPSGLITYWGRDFKTARTQVDIGIQIRETGTTNWFDFDEYDFNIDGRFTTGNSEDLNIFLKPDTVDILENFNVTNPSGSGSTRYWRARSTINAGNIIRYRVAESTGVNSQKLQVGDKIYLNDNLNRFSTSFVRVLELLDSESTPGADYHVVRTTNFNTYTTEFEYSFGSNSSSFVPELDWLYDPSFGFPDQGPTANSWSLKTRAFSSGSEIKITEKTTTPFGFTIKINPKQGRKQWDVRVTYRDFKMLDNNNNEIFYYDNIRSQLDNFNWEGIKGHSSQGPLNSNKTHTYMEVKVKATDQLNGRLDNLSAECISLLDWYDDVNGIWKKKYTSNPAWVFVDLLTGEVNQRAISKDKLDVDSIVAWAKYCEENTITFQGNTAGFEANFVLDFRSTVKQLIDQVTSVGRATLNVSNGKYGVVIDEYRDTPTQMFNERNVISFSSQRVYSKVPDAIRCFFIDPLSNWQKREVIAYNDGFNSSNAEVVEDLDIFACTNLAQAWRQGRYYLAIQKLRQDTVTIEVDFENLVCSRGDLVYFSYDVMKEGGLPGRIKSINGNNVTLDIDVSSLGGSEILRIRKRIDGEILDYNVLSILSSNELELDSVSGIQVGDLFVYGLVESATKKMLVKSIQFSDEFSASINLIEYNEAIYTADQETIPDYVIGNLNNPLSENNYPDRVENLTATYNVDCNESSNSYIYTVDLLWDAPPQGDVSLYEVYKSINGNQELVGYSKNNTFTYEVLSQNIGIEHTFKVLAVNGLGRKIPIGNAVGISVTPEADTVRPGDVQNLNANVLTETIALNWDLVSDCDIDRYYIRFSPKTQNASWGQSVAVTSTGAKQNTVQVPLRTGTYFVRAVDWAGNSSVSAAFVVTQVPELQNVEFITEVNAPLWEGTYDETANFGDSLTLRSNDGLETFTSTNGSFVFQETFDLGDIYTARFESNVLASGFTKNSLMVNWDTLADIDQIAGGFNDDDWDVGTYIRSRDFVNYMSSWSTLSDVDYLSFGSEATAKPWQKFTNADFTGRIFQLKVELDSQQFNVSPIVDDVNIIANWTERIEEGRDVISGDTVEFNFPFIETPVIQLTSQENITQGDYYQFVSKNESGFVVQFYDKDDNAVNDRKYDWIAKGYGKKYNLEDINF